MSEASQTFNNFGGFAGYPNMSTKNQLEVLGRLLSSAKNNPNQWHSVVSNMVRVLKEKGELVVDELTKLESRAVDLDYMISNGCTPQEKAQLIREQSSLVFLAEHREELFQLLQTESNLALEQ